MHTGAQQIATGFLNPSASITKGWNNPPTKHVLGFTAQPKELAADDILVGKVSFQVTSWSYEMDSPNHWVVRVTVKNNGPTAGAFNLLMSWIG